MAEGRTSVVFLSTEPLHPSPPGPQRRTIKLAEAVAERCDVTLAAPSGSAFPDGPFRTRETGAAADPDLRSALAGCDAAVVPTLPSPRQLLVARRSAPRLVVDMVAPLGLEAAEVGGGGATQNALARWRVREQALHLALADLVLCSNDRQRDLALGVALAAGAMHRPAVRGSLADRIAVVPHGMDAEPAGTGRLPLREARAVDPSDRIVLWAGGMWSWFDPLTAVKAIERLRARRADVKLAIVAFEHPDPVQRAAHAAPAAEVERYVRERGLEDGVVLSPEWLSREAYFDHLREADAGLSLHHATLESRFAARTRIVDYLQAGLRVVCTAGDTMADLVAANGFGEVVAPGDPAACAAAVDRLTSGRREPLDTRAALAAFEWSNVARPLVDFCAAARGGGPPPPAPALLLTARQYPAFAAAVYRGGPRDLVAAAARRARAAARRFGATARR